MWSLQLAVKPPGHNLIHVNKWFLKMYHTCAFAGLVINGHLDHETNITIEFTSKNSSQKCITLVCLPDLPYVVILITKLTSPLNSHQKMVPEDDEDSMGTAQGLYKDSTRTLWTPQDFEGIIRTFEQVMQSP